MYVFEFLCIKSIQIETQIVSLFLGGIQNFAVAVKMKSVENSGTLSTL